MQQFVYPIANCDNVIPTLGAIPPSPMLQGELNDRSTVYLCFFGFLYTLVITFVVSLSAQSFSSLSHFVTNLQAPYSLEESLKNPIFDIFLIKSQILLLQSIRWDEESYSFSSFLNWTFSIISAPLLQ